MDLGSTHLDLGLKGRIIMPIRTEGEVRQWD